VDEVDTGGWAPPDPALTGGPGEPSGEASPAHGRPDPARPPGAAVPPHGAWPAAQGAAADEQPPYGPVPYGPAPYAAPYGRPPAPQPWIVETPEGTPYHQMARTAVQRWWRPVAGTAAIALTGMAALMAVTFAWLIAVAAGTGTPLMEVIGRIGGPDDPMLGSLNAELAFTLLSVAVFLPFILLAAPVFQRRRPGTLSSVAGRLRLRWMAVCAGLAVLTGVVGVVFSWAAGVMVDDPVTEGGAWVGWSSFLPTLLIVVLLVPFQSAAEEYFFRGWLLQAIGSCTLQDRTAPLARKLSVVFRTPWPAICAGGLAFAAGHGYTGWGVVDIFGFAVIAGWVTVRTGGLEAAIAVHVVNNVGAFLIPAAVGRLSLEQGAVPLPYVVADLLPLLLYAACVDRLARRRRVQTVTAASG